MLRPIHMFCLADYDDEANDLVCSQPFYFALHPTIHQQDISLKLAKLILDYEWIPRLSFEGSQNIT